ncbi:uncharacterized protein LOC127870732 isoform X2 [Dreissena polymorpha]|uniref:TIR domain-containing protein n=2 Tax=Dreissena polymorpha TaxID=45954 RepID=A0A9D4LAJ1_DREPO|nr:uncharacterized protein LOC127870732 isoform X2 [Dreissena polymorpha]KAH3854304.1 hypothetical protein DPMN_096841 [Dreissena polymorpha]
MLIYFGTSNIEWDGEENFPYIDIAGNDRFPESKRAIFYYCLCPHAFGIHRINFMRYVDIPGKSKGFYENVQHPYALVVLPQSKLSLFRYLDDSAVYAELENLVLTEQPIELIGMKVDSLIGLLGSNEEKVLLMANVVQNVMFAFIYVILLVIISVLSKWYSVCLIRIPARRLLRSLPNIEQMLLLEGPAIDVFISHSDEDRSFVIGTIVPFLTEHDRVNVCFSGSEEFTPNQPLIRQLYEKITKSSKLLVVLSTSYHEDILCEQLQLEHIILPLLYEEHRQKTDILFILYDDGARFPEILRWNFDAHRLSWNNHLPERVLLGSIRRWITTGNM